MRCRFLLILLAATATGAAARDLTLADAERLFAERNREVLASRRAIESAQAQRTIAAARLNPTLSLNTSGINSNPGIGAGPLNQKRIDTVLRIDQPIERGGKRELRIDAAESLELAARNDSLDVLRQQLAQMRSAYYDLKQAAEKLEILADTAQLFGRTLAAAQLRLKAGDLSSADVAKIQVDYERAQNDAQAARAERSRASLVLGYLLGQSDPAQELRATDAWPARESPEVPSYDAVVESRPDVIAARTRIAASERMRDLARSQRTRDVTFGAQFERQPGSLPANSIGIGVSIPLFTGYDFSGDIQRAEIDRNAAVDALDKARALALAEILRAESDLKNAAARLERYETNLLAAAGRSAQAAEFAFERGAASVLEVLDARRTLRAVQLEALAARADYAKALAAWIASRTTHSASPDR